MKKNSNVEENYLNVGNVVMVSYVDNEEIKQRKEIKEIKEKTEFSSSEVLESNIKWSQCIIIKIVPTGIRIQWVDGNATQLIKQTDVKLRIREMTPIEKSNHYNKQQQLLLNEHEHQEQVEKEEQEQESFKFKSESEKMSENNVHQRYASGDRKGLCRKNCNGCHQRYASGDRKGLCRKNCTGCKKNENLLQEKKSDLLKKNLQVAKEKELEELLQGRCFYDSDHENLHFSITSISIANNKIKDQNDTLWDLDYVENHLVPVGQVIAIRFTKEEKEIFYKTLRHYGTPGRNQIHDSMELYERISVEINKEMGIKYNRRAQTYSDIFIEKKVIMNVIQKRNGRDVEIYYLFMFKKIQALLSRYQYEVPSNQSHLVTNVLLSYYDLVITKCNATEEEFFGNTTAQNKLRKQVHQLIRSIKSGKERVMRLMNGRRKT